jgi:hypothetical protein
MQMNRHFTLHSLEKTLCELQSVRRLEKSNLLLANGSNKDTIEKFIVKLDKLIAGTENKIRQLTYFH